VKESDKMKKTALLAAILVVLALFWALPAFPGPIPASVVPGSARWVAHLDVEKFVATKFFAAINKGEAFQIKTRDAGRWLKLDPTKDITGVTLIGFESGAKGEPVVVVSGTFDKAQLLGLIALDEKHTETAYGAYTVYSSGGEGCGAFLNDNLVVLSEDRSALERVLDTASGKSKNFAGSELAASLKDVPTAAFLSGVLPDLSGLGKEINQSKVLEKASGLFFLAEERADRLLVRLQVTADTPESAKNMYDVVQGLIAMGKLGMQSDDASASRIASLVEGLQIKQDGKILRIELDRPSQEIADLVNRGRGLHGLLD
jgi:hypothetical protein